jgi:cell division protein FtsW (lipid II flippase)
MDGVVSRIGGRPFELRLLMLALVIFIIGEETLVSVDNQPASSVLPAIVALGLVFLVAHFWLALNGALGDEVLLPAAAVLTAISLAMVQRLHPSSFLPQFIWIVLGFALAAAIAGSRFELWWLSRYKYTFAAAGFALLVITALFGRQVNGARLWIGVGPLQFQSTEVMKLVLVIFVAGYLEEKRDLLTLGEHRWGPLRLPPLQYVGPLGVMWLASLLSLLWQRDLGGTLLLLGVALAMLYAGTGRASYVVGGLALFLLNVVLTYHFFGYVRARVDVWIDPWTYARDQGYQIVQALYAVSSGGIFGAGLGQGMPGYIPEVYTDFVYAAIAEELGLLGALAILVLFLIVVFRGLRIALRCPGPFEQMLALGLACLLGLQCLVIVAGNLEVIPLTGITLPFVSYGGSSMVINFIILGILLRLSSLAEAARSA